MRGEHAERTTAAVNERGSSPHARGALCGAFALVLCKRIIPACAGSTMRLSWRWVALLDHPRMRGEHANVGDTPAPVAGSSPHARGAPSRTPRALAECGIIPACAGSTVCLNSSSWRGRDHPRMRGEHRCIIELTPRHIGSSPHARGAPAKKCLAVAAIRIIPACAGSTFDTGLDLANRGDHPRMRGEHLLMSSRGSLLMGSSPHARGARSQ